MKKYEKALIYLFPFLYVVFGWIGLGAGLRALGGISSVATYGRPVLAKLYLYAAPVFLCALVLLVIYNIFLLLKDDENAPRRIYTELAILFFLIALLVIFEPPLFDFIEQYHLEDFLNLFR